MSETLKQETTSIKRNESPISSTKTESNRKTIYRKSSNWLRRLLGVPDKNVVAEMITRQRLYPYSEEGILGEKLQGYEINPFYNDTTVNLPNASYRSSVWYNPETQEWERVRTEGIDEGIKKFKELYKNAEWMKPYVMVPVQKEGDKVVKDKEPAKKLEPIEFDDVNYTGDRYINTKGDTISLFGTSRAKPGQLYEIRYTSKKGGDGSATLTTRQESGQLSPGPWNRISRTSDWGKTIDDYFYDKSKTLPISEDYSKKPFIIKWLYKLAGYKHGGLLMRKGGKIVEIPFNN